jgi:hypothetical protein
MKAFWKTYLLLAVAGALGVFIYLDWKKPSGDDKKEKVFSADKNKVKSFTLSREGGDKIAVSKEGESWKLVSPANVPADANAVDTVLSTLESAEISATVTEQPASLAGYGLETPRLTVAVVAEGPEQRLLLGRHTPDETGVYAKYADKGRVFTVPAQVEASLLKKPVDLRDRSVLHMKREMVKRVDLKGPDADVLLVKDEKGDWNFERPLKTKAARWGVDGMLLGIENLLFEEVAAEEAHDFKPYGLDRPTWTAILELTDGSAKKLEIGSSKDPAAAKVYAVDPNSAPPPKYYARDASHNLVGVIAATLVDDLSKAKSSLRSRYLLDFPALDVNRVEVTSDGKTRVYARTVTKDAGGTDVRKWKQTSPAIKEIETKTIEDLLFSVASNDVQEFLDTPGQLAKYGLDTPAIHAALTFDNKLPGWFEVGQKDGVFYGRRDNDATITKLGTRAKNVVEDFKTKL